MSLTPKLPMSWQSLLVQPHPVARPIVHEGLGFFRLPAWKRSLVSIAYGVRRLEYWLAPQGWLREYFRLHVLAVGMIGTSILLLGPVVTALLVSISDWTNLLVNIFVKIMSMIAILPPVILVVVTGVFLWNIMRRRRRPHRPHSTQQFYE